MAKISAAVDESVFTIKKWLGVNQAQEGESRLKYGEAAVMRNFKITSGGALRKRSGSKNVAGLLSTYNVEADTDTTSTIETQYGTPTALTMYPQATTDSVGNPLTSGTGVSVTAVNHADYTNYYYGKNNAVYQFVDVVATDRTSVDDSRGYACDGALSNWYTPWILCYDSVVWNGTSYTCTGQHIINAMESTVAGKYIPGEYGQSVWRPYNQRIAPAVSEFAPYDNADGKICKFDSKTHDEWNSATGALVKYKVNIITEAKWEWKFHPTSATSNTSDSVVRGIWSGFVDDDEVLCTACNGHLWQLSLNSETGAWSKTDCGTIDTSQDVCMFGFDKKLYLLNGTQYKVWDGSTLSDVAGYRPLVATETIPAGGGTSREQVNKLNGQRRVRFSPDGTATVFQLPEKALASIDYVKNTATGATLTTSATSTANGTVTFSAAPTAGVNSIEVGYTASTNFASTVKAMRFAELYNGSQDTRIFIYGDGSNKAFYSGLDYDGKARADYFPDMNEAAIGDSNTPITAMIRHYDRLLAFKLDSAYSIYYNTITLVNGDVTAGFYVTPVNRDIGNCAIGQARIVENRPRTLDGRSVIEWKATSTSGNVTGDQRNAQRVSQRVDNTIRTFDLDTAHTFYDKLSHEYYVIGSNGTALVHNTEADAWYTYTNFAATCLIRYADELYFGTADGYLRHCSDDYMSDNDAAIDCYWESGSMSFDRDYKRKYSAMLWVGIKPDDNGYLKVSSETDIKDDFAEYSFSTNSDEDVPKMNRIKLKAKKFTYYKLKFANNTADKTATVVSADIRVRGTGFVR